MIDGEALIEVKQKFKKKIDSKKVEKKGRLDKSHSKTQQTVLAVHERRNRKHCGPGTEQQRGLLGFQC